jgi:hypothetical protein
MEPKLAVFQIEVSQETGQVMLLIETGCGMKPVMGWPDINSMEGFAKNLLAIGAHAGVREHHPLLTQIDIQ